MKAFHKEKSGSGSPLFHRRRKGSDASDGNSQDAVTPTPSRKPLTRFRRTSNAEDTGRDTVSEPHLLSSPGRPRLDLAAVVESTSPSPSPKASPRGVHKLPRSPSSQLSLASLLNSPRTTTRANSLLESPPDHLARALEEIRALAVSGARDKGQGKCAQIVRLIDNIDGYQSAKATLSDKNMSMKLLHYASEKNMHNLVSFWLTVDDFEGADAAKRQHVAHHLHTQYIASHVLHGVVPEEKLEAIYAGLSGTTDVDPHLFRDLQMTIEDIIEDQLMPGFLMSQRAESSKLASESSKLASASHSKIASLRGKSSRQGTPSSKELAASLESAHTIQALRVEVNDLKEQAEAWKTSYLHAKEQLVKSEKVTNKLLESYRKDEAEIVRLKRDLKDAKSRRSPAKAKMRNGPHLSPSATERPLPPPPSAAPVSQISSPTMVTSHDDSTPLTLGEVDKYALMRIRSSKDFDVHAVLGKGNFGVVFLATEKRTKRTLAVKRMNKNLLIDRNQVLTILTEVQVMKEASAGNSPWLVRLHYSWNDPLFLYLAMDFCHGGDLRCLLENVELEEPAVRFFAAEMIQAVHALHGRGFVHRDLKPENFLLHRSGHVKLADFGLSKAGYEMDQAAEAVSKRKKIVAQAMRVFVEDKETKASVHYTVIVNASTRVGDVVQMTLEKLPEAQRNVDYVLYEEGITGAANFLKELDVNLLISEVTNVWTETRADLPEADVKFKLVLKERVALRDFARRKRRNQRQTMHLNRNAIRDPYYKAPQMSKREKLYSVVGTPHYMAREILEGQGYEAVVDFWSIGCIVFEMLTGDLPFSGATPEELFQAVLSSDEALCFPDSVSAEARDLVCKFLSPPKERLGYNGVEEIQSHPFFASIDWAKLDSMEPPFVPEVEGDMDLSYFESPLTGEEVPKTLDTPIEADDVTALVYDPFSKTEFNFSIRN